MFNKKKLSGLCCSFQAFILPRYLDFVGSVFLFVVGIVSTGQISSFSSLFLWLFCYLRVSDLASAHFLVACTRAAPGLLSHTSSGRCSCEQNLSRLLCTPWIEFWFLSICPRLHFNPVISISTQRLGQRARVCTEAWCF
jgi:hypothetical protein